MNDNASLALGATRTGFGGLPQRLVQDGVVEHAAMLHACLLYTSLALPFTALILVRFALLRLFGRSILQRATSSLIVFSALTLILLYYTCLLYTSRCV